jgi:hypothetical protein
LAFGGFKKYCSEIVWDSEVWITDVSDHVIHFNSEKFLGLTRRWQKTARNRQAGARMAQ